MPTLLTLNQDLTPCPPSLHALIPLSQLPQAPAARPRQHHPDLLLSPSQPVPEQGCLVLEPVLGCLGFGQLGHQFVDFGFVVDPGGGDLGAGWGLGLGLG